MSGIVKSTDSTGLSKVLLFNLGKVELSDRSEYRGNIP